jgi:hypothetical protein
MSLSPKYTFLSWYRQGLATYIQQPDDSSQPSSDLSLTFGITLEEQQGGNSTNITQTMPLVGPENIVNIRAEAVIQTVPLEASSTHPAGHVVALEFYDEDFPWRYTPAAPHQNKLRPWIWLLVLEEGEYRLHHQGDRPLPYITLEQNLLDGTPNPALQIPPDGAWSWAHVQVNQPLNTSFASLETALQTALDTDPDVAFSRIIAPRNLKAATKYQAFLVPFFERGRLAGLGQDSSTAAVLDVAWATNDLNSSSKEFPFYYEWSFATSADGDFETLARKLKPQELDDLSLATMNVEGLLKHFEQQISTNDATKVVQLPSTLMPVDQLATEWPAPTSTADMDIQTAIQNDLNPVLDTANTPVAQVPMANMQEDIIANKPPVYGKWHLDRAAWQALNGNLDASNTGWIHQANTNLQNRALAGLGVQVVREHQEKFMAAAWAQVGEVIEANKSIHQHLLSRETTHQLHQRLKRSSQDTTIALTGSLQSKVLYKELAGNQATSIEQAIKGSNLSLASTNSAFTKLRRPSSKAIKKLKKQAATYLSAIQPNQNFLTNINQTVIEEINGAPQKPSPYQVVGVSSSNSATTSGSSDADNLAAHITTLGQPSPASTDLATQKTAVQQATDPLFTLNKRLLDQLTVPTNNSTLQVSTNRLQPILAAPELETPLYPYLKKITQQFVMPDLAAYGDNFVGLMEVNQAVIEQFLLGANHEMARELLWRGYPTDQRGSYFRQFWNVKDHIQLGQGQVPYKDITPLHTWTSSSPLGTHRSAGYPATPTVLVIKGELLSANPDLVIYAQQAVANPLLANDPNARPKKLLHPTKDATTVKYPIFKANLEPDVLALGFDLDVATAKGDASQEGWFFILQQRPGKIKLGMDEGYAAPITLDTIHDLHWQHMPTTTGGITYLDPNQNLPYSNGTSLPLATNAAQLARQLYQAPLMLGIHATRLLP